MHRTAFPSLYPSLNAQQTFSHPKRSCRLITSCLYTVAMWIINTQEDADVRLSKMLMGMTGEDPGVLMQCPFSGALMNKLFPTAPRS